MSESEALSSGVAGLKSMLDGFIETECIDPAVADRLTSLIRLVEAQRNKWALNEKLGRIQGLVVYGAYKSCHSLLFNMREALVQAQAHGENPTTAERALEVFEDLKTTLDLASEAATRHSPVSFNQLERQTSALYVKGRSYGFLPSLEEEIRAADKNNMATLFSKLQEEVVASTG